MLTQRKQRFFIYFPHQKNDFFSFVSFFFMGVDTISLRSTMNAHRWTFGSWVVKARRHVWQDRAVGLFITIKPDHRGWSTTDETPVPGFHFRTRMLTIDPRVRAASTRHTPRIQRSLFHFYGILFFWFSSLLISNELFVRMPCHCCDWMDWFSIGQARIDHV